jgi:hypothetical protein
MSSHKIINLFYHPMEIMSSINPISISYALSIYDLILCHLLFLMLIMIAIQHEKDVYQYLYHMDKNIYLKTIFSSPHLYMEDYLITLPSLFFHPNGLL